jgi:hypothetical protein
MASNMPWLVIALSHFWGLERVAGNTRPLPQILGARGKKPQREEGLKFIAILPWLSTSIFPQRLPNHGESWVSR